MIALPGICQRMSAEYKRAALKFITTQNEILDEWGKGPLRDMNRIADLTAIGHRLKHNYDIQFEDLPGIEKDLD